VGVRLGTVIWPRPPTAWIGSSSRFNPARVCAQLTLFPQLQHTLPLILILKLHNQHTWLDGGVGDVTSNGLHKVLGNRGGPLIRKMVNDDLPFVARGGTTLIALMVGSGGLVMGGDDGQARGVDGRLEAVGRGRRGLMAGLDRLVVSLVVSLVVAAASLVLGLVFSFVRGAGALGTGRGLRLRGAGN